jgi:hypothetical protein
MTAPQRQPSSSPNQSAGPGWSPSPSEPDPLWTRILGRIIDVGSVVIGLPIIGVIGYFMSLAAYDWSYPIGDGIGRFVDGGGPPGSPPALPPDAVAEFRAVVALWLFILALVLFLRLLAKLPLKPTWLDHTLTARRLNVSPTAFLIFTGVANSKWANTVVGQELLTWRLWTGFLLFLVGNLYLVVWRLRCPQPIRVSEGAEVYHYRELFNREPATRYLLSLLLGVSTLNMGCLVFTLIPSSLAKHPPEWSWWCLLWPPGCS